MEKTIILSQYRPSLLEVTGEGNPALPVRVERVVPQVVPYAPDVVEYRPLPQEVIVRHVHTVDIGSVVEAAKAVIKLFRAEKPTLREQVRAARPDPMALCFIPKNPVPFRPSAPVRVERGGGNVINIYGGNNQFTVNNF